MAIVEDKAKLAKFVHETALIVDVVGDLDHLAKMYPVS